LLSASGRRAFHPILAGVVLNKSRQPILNVPPVDVAMLIIIVAVYAVQMLLPLDSRRLFDLRFGFVPARYDSNPFFEGVLPGGPLASYWSFFTYALLHGNLAHLGFNAVWLLAFASPVARRFGTVRFLLFFAVATGAGALAYLFVHPKSLLPMVGASAGISGLMGGAARFVFEPGGSLDAWRVNPATADHVQAAPLLVALRRRRVLTFLLTWFGLNLLFGIVSVPGVSAGMTVAWEAHLGGFLAGLLLFDAFDPLLRPRNPEEGHRG
jgi:membrane associated rhomboid family serine protease